VCVELYFTVLGKEQYIERDDTVCDELYCNMIKCVLNYILQCWERNST